MQLNQKENKNEEQKNGSNSFRELDSALRPGNFKEFVGQEKIRKNLSVFIQAAQDRSEAIDHTLFYGPSGLGKTTLAHILAAEMGVGIKITSGPAIERVGDLGAILTNLSDGDILFIDEIHRLHKVVEEVLYPAMEDFAFDIIIGKGPSARTLRLDLPRFTLIGATTRIGLLSSPLLNRFGIVHRLDLYYPEDIEQIVTRSGKILNIELEKEGVEKIARSSRSTPRIANRLLKRVRDFAQVKGEGKITKKIAQEALDAMEVDEFGLEKTDRKILEVMINQFKGRPVGIKTLAAAASEEEDTIEDVYEPYLLQLGFISRTPRGRIPTELAYKHLGIEYDEKNQEKLL
jgi:Holliday junction DNA helicase RuvB